MLPDLSDSVTAAQAILGWKIVHNTPLGPVGGTIIETEAYAADDPASHSFKGVTLRTQPMLKQAGTMYMYFIYGKHWCFNIVTGPEGSGEAVLIRALLPTDGIDIMQTNRKTKNMHNLCNGPGSLVQALAIPSAYNGQLLSNTDMRLIPSGSVIKNIQVGKRIGISKATEKLWRFYLKT